VMPCETPVAVFIFNRVGPTRILMNRVAAARPKNLFVFADGPRQDRPDDAERCAEARKAVFDRVDWPCEINDRLSPKNLGCNGNIVSGCDFLFSKVERAVILEDDCIPEVSFFQFCDALLDRYATHGAVQHICGYNPLGTWQGDSADYLFSQQCTRAWGWATWRRAWALYDNEMTSWWQHRSQGTNRPPWFAQVNSDFFNHFGDDLPPTWDYRLSYAILANSGITIVPKRNLVSNIGHGNDATHSTKKRTAERSYEIDQPLRHPASVVIDRDFDSCLQGRLSQKFAYRVARRIGSIFSQQAR
jgi:hypothetical protein